MFADVSLFVSQAKSVQEKLVEAILKESQCSSEPELSDTSTDDDEEESAQKDPEPDTKGTRFLLKCISKHKTWHLYTVNTLYFQFWFQRKQ